MAPNSEPNDRIRLRLFVAGEEPNSQTARTNLDHICQTHLAERTDVKIEIEIVDVLQNYRKALESRVLLTPALLVVSADHTARVTGTLQEPERVLAAMGLANRA
ncbi:MAG TPA: circadian clock KaiB family protein [Terracidiphilus sp.]|nr:circadian clock KaiB family protein [Terracidiphilus sp.]